MGNCTINDINPYIINCFHTNQSNCPPHGTDYGKRVVKWYEVELILWGEGYIITEGKKIPAQKGDIFFRRPGMVVQGFAPYHCYLVVFDIFSIKGISNYQGSNLLNTGSFFNDLYNGDIVHDEVEGLSLPHVMRIPRYTEFEKLFSDIYNEYIYNRKESQFFLKTYLMQILMLMYNEMACTSWLRHPNRSFRLNYVKVMNVKNYIDQNIQSCFKLDELAGIAGLSPNFLCKIFKDVIGDTPINYINKSKISMAKKLLIETSKDIKQIAYHCGFENDTYFFRLFKKIEGLSPSAFRERQQLAFLYQSKQK